MPRPPNYNEHDVRDKPSFLGRYNRSISRRREGAIAKRFRERWESLLAVDEGVEQIIEELRRTGELDNTYVIFTSDNGFMQGEHRVRQGKMLPYDASTHLPLLIRGPGVRRDRRTKAVVGDVDLAPTIIDITSARPGHALDGRSVLPYTRNTHLRNLRPFLHTTAGQGSHGRTNTREGGAKGTETRVPAWAAVRTTRWLYVAYKGRGSRAVRPQARPVGDELARARPALPAAAQHAAPRAPGPQDLPRPQLRQARVGVGAVSGEEGAALYEPASSLHQP